MKELHTEIEINAPAQRVWDTLIDIQSYPEWNPFIRWIKGELKNQSRITVRLQPSNAKGMTFRPNIIKFEPNKELRWLGHLFFPGLFDGEHIFFVESVSPDRTRFVHREVFTGILLPLLQRMLDTDTRRGFNEMNNALKKRVEGSS